LAVEADTKVAFINANTNGAGTSRVYAFNTTTWSNDQVIPAPVGSFFGTRMAIRDGTLAVGSTTINQGKGSVFFYRKPANTWDLIGQYDGIAPSSGRAIALDQDNTVLVGAHGESNSQQAGSVTVVKLLLNDGSACNAPTECASGFCVDKVCCDTLCDGACQACSAAFKGSGNDGVCESLAAGASDTACPKGGDVCGTTGLCDDKGACALVAAQTPCGKSCGDPGAPALIEALCDGSGTCAPGAPSSCGNYACADGDNGAECLTSCELPDQCAPGNLCVGGQCVGPLGNGAACKENAACASNFCVDGVCCDTACDGACQACAASLGASADGACTGTCADGLCVDDTCQPAGGAGGDGGSAGSGGAAGGPGKGLPDLWKDQEVGGGSGVPGGVGGSVSAGAGGVYQRPKASALPLVLRDEDDGCGCRVAGAASPTPTASLAWLSVLGLLVCRRNRRP
jgi:MYXO-CTERM domain-containing protein